MAKEIIDVVKSQYPEGVQLTIIRIIPEFLRGRLLVLSVKDTLGSVAENYFYLSSLSFESRPFSSLAEFAAWVNKQPRVVVVTEQRGTLAVLTRVETIAGILALLIMLMICAIVLTNIPAGRDEIKIPGILTNSLTTILGFYFGSQVARHREANVGRSGTESHPQDSSGASPRSAEANPTVTRP